MAGGCAKRHSRCRRTARAQREHFHGGHDDATLERGFGRDVMCGDVVLLFLLSWRSRQGDDLR